MTLLEKECKLEKSSQKNTDAINDFLQCLHDFGKNGEKRISVIIEDIRKSTRI